MITQQEYHARRQQIMQQVGKNAMVIVRANKEILRNGDAAYSFRQNSDFSYLTGFPEPDAIMILMTGNKNGEYILFNRPKNLKQEVWTGPRIGQKKACADYAADRAFPISDFFPFLEEYLVGCEKIYAAWGDDIIFDKKIFARVKEIEADKRLGHSCPEKYVRIQPLLHEMRLIKSPAEIEIIRRACAISMEAHQRCWRYCQAGMAEYELEAILMQTFYHHGSRSPAYASIVGAGVNACILHYTENNSELKAGELVLIDAGAEVENYASDVTRTFPVNGKFSAEQKAIYTIVLAAQQAIFDLIKPGVSWNRLQQAAIHAVTQGLCDVGILTGSVEENIEKKHYRQFYMHGFGHYLGLDVHDVGEYKVSGEWRKLLVGMVFTVEPGIYITAGQEGVDKKWWNIGIRIEDNVLVTQSGCDVLTAALPRRIEAIEAIMSDEK